MPVASSFIYERIAPFLSESRRVRAFVCFSPVNVYWASRFRSTSCVLLVERGSNVYVFTDSRYEERACSHFLDARVMVGKHGALQEFLNFLKKRNRWHIALDSDELTGSELLAVQEALRERMHIQKGLWRKMRAFKTDEEIFMLEKAYKKHKPVINALLEFLSCGPVPRSEHEISLFLKRKLLEAGFDNWSFEPMVLSGKRTSCPHGENSRNSISRKGPFLIDFGGVFSGWCSDETIMIYSDETGARRFKDYHLALKEAMDTAIDMIKPGVRCSDVDAVARAVLKKYKLADHFTHGLGHGVGLEVHEEPIVNSRSEIVLERGMVFTIEPGVYFSGRFGLRLESTVVVERNGARVISTISKNPLMLR